MKLHDNSFLVFSSADESSEGKRDPVIKLFGGESTERNYDLARDWVRRDIREWRMCDYVVDDNRNTKEYDSMNRRIKWRLDRERDCTGHIIYIIEIQPQSIGPDTYALPQWFVYDHDYETWDWLMNDLDALCHLANTALHSRGYNTEFKTFEKDTHDYYQACFQDIERVIGGSQHTTCCVEDSDSLSIYHKIQY